MIGNDSVVDDRVAGQQQQPVLPQPREGLLGAGNLAGRCRIGVVERIGIQDRGHARAFLIAGRRVERERQVEPVGALVFDQTLLDLAHDRRRIGNVRERGRARGVARLRPRGASTEAPSVRTNRFGGSFGDWCQVRNDWVPAPVNATKRSKAALSLRNRRSVLSVVRSSRSRNGRLPAGDAPSPSRKIAPFSTRTTRKPFGRGWVTGVPGSAYCSSLDRSHSRCCVTCGASTSTMKVRRQWRLSSYSDSSARSGCDVHAKPP